MLYGFMDSFPEIGKYPKIGKKLLFFAMWGQYCADQQEMDYT